ncbi:hypothetical protein KBI23_01325 [bacterium]|nr:hypothetical protein [bacterium]MBP9807086.1 hypothetical protein [bacterium]
MREVERTVIRTADSVPVRIEDSSSNWTVALLALAAIALVIGAIAMFNNNNTATLRQQAIELQQTSLQQQQQNTQQLQDMTATQQAIQAARPASTNVVITDGLNGGAGPGSKVVAPQPLKVPAPAAPAAPAQPADSADLNP